MPAKLEYVENWLFTRFDIAGFGNGVLKVAFTILLTPKATQLSGGVERYKSSLASDNEQLQF